jgi:hypothetical protein
MQADDLEMFQESIEQVYAFYGKDCSRFALDVWWQALKPFDLRAIQDALGRHCVNPDNGQFMPKPADVMRMMEGSTLDSAVQAWTKIERAITSVGTYQTVVFDDPLIHRVISDMGGWPAFGQKSVDEWPFVGKEFQTRYRGYKSRREIPEYPPKLVGLIDGENVQHGFQEQKPVLIGNEVRARQVIEKGKDTPLLTVTEMA